jgi:hypothetical protein
LTSLIRDSLNTPGASLAESRAALAQTAGLIAPGVGANRLCRACQSSFGLVIGDTGRCPSCGTPWST